MSTLRLELGAPAKGSAWRLLAGSLAALAAHALVVLIAMQCEGELPPAGLVITEVDLAPPPAPPPPPPLVPEPPAQPAASQPAPAARAPRRAASAPAPAAAGNLHLAKEEAPSSSEPVRFAVDANGAGFGFGVVAAGGAGQGRGGSGSPSSAPAAPTVPAPNAGSAALRNFAVPPRLDESDPCRGYFPGAASVDRGEVTLKLLVSSQGRVERATVLAEQPAGQGFGRSAVQCLKEKRFLPAQDAEGRPQASEAPVAVRFSR